MFDCVTCTWNPLGGECPHNCSYCWAKQLAKRHNMKKYQGQPRLIPKELKRKFKPDEFVFVQDMSDLFANTVPQQYIQQVLDHTKQFPHATFLLLTKNPKRYHEFNIPDNCICGVTIETDHYPEQSISNAPLVGVRYYYMMGLRDRCMVSIEPIIDFNLVVFLGMIAHIEPEFVYIGYDNYNNNLPEPSVEKVDQLISRLKEFTEVREKPSIQKRREQ